MRKLVCSIFVAVVLLAYSCDSIEGDFNESVPDLYTLATSVLPEDTGTIQPSGGEFLVGESRQILAQAADGYVFDHWTGDLTGDSNPISIQFNSNKSITAHFSLREYSLNIEIIGRGAVNETVVEQSATITVRLEAEAEEGWFFERWDGDLSGNFNPETLTINGEEEKIVKAVFKEIPPEEYSVTINTDGFGTVEKDPYKEIYIDGDELTLTARAASLWIFKEWRGDLSGSSNPTLIVVDEDKKITAVFERKLQEEYAVIVSTEGSGSVVKDPDKSVYLEGEEVSLTANAAPGWSFSEWKGDLTGSLNPSTLIVDTDIEVIAVFAKIPTQGITVQEVQFYINEMVLDGARGLGDYKTKDFILNIPLDGSPFEVTHVQIPEGYYDELQLNIKKTERKIELN